MTLQRWNPARRRLVVIVFVILGVGGRPLQAQVAGPDIDPFEDLTTTPADDAATVPADDSSAVPAAEGQKDVMEAWQEVLQMAEDGKCAAALPRIDEITRFIQTNIQGMQAKILRIRSGEETGDEAEVNTAFGQASEFLFQVQIQRAKCLADMKEYSLALESLEMLSESMRTPRPEPILETGKIQYETRSYKDAIESFGQAIRLNALQPEYLFWRGKTQMRLAEEEAAYSYGSSDIRGSVKVAVQSFDRAIELKEDYAEAYLQRAFAKSMLGDIEEALDDMNRAVELDPENPDYLARVGNLHIQQASVESAKFSKDADEVIAEYRAAIGQFDKYLAEKGDSEAEKDADDDDPEKVRPEDVYLRRASARLQLANEQGGDASQPEYQLAIQDCDRAMEFDISDDIRAGALLQRGVAERMSGDLRQAIKSLSEAQTLPSQYPGEALLRRGIIHLRLGDVDSAMGDFQRAMEVQLPEDPDARARFWTGVIHAQRGEYMDAIRMYNAAIRRNPGYKPAYSNRGLAYMRLGLYDGAARDFAELVRRDPEDEIALRRRDTARQLAHGNGG